MFGALLRGGLFARYCPVVGLYDKFMAEVNGRLLVWQELTQ
jgi:hypothetical protein